MSGEESQDTCKIKKIGFLFEFDHTYMLYVYLAKFRFQIRVGIHGLHCFSVGIVLL